MDCTRRGAEKQYQPPALPVKQRRTVCSSLDLEIEGTVFGPSGPQSPASPFISVFFSTTACNAPQCPIHHRYAEPSDCHQERFFSAKTPPPVPKKRLARTASLPEWCLHPHGHQSYDNPLYMLAPIEDALLHADGEEEREAHAGLLPAQPLNQLSFDTPDQQLPYFFSDFRHPGQVSQGIQQRHLLFLRNIAQCLETSPFPWEQCPEGIEALQPQDFVLYKECKPKQIEEDVFYMVYCPKFKGRVFAAKVNSESSIQTCHKYLPPHANVQQFIVYFSQCLEKETQQDCRFVAPQSPCEGSTEVHNQQPDSADWKRPTVLSLLNDGNNVTIERDLPWGNLEDFVQEGSSLHCAEPQVYERQLSLLLLQLAQGLQHLQSHKATCTELKPQSILLVWPEKQRKQLTEQTEEADEKRKLKKDVGGARRRPTPEESRGGEEERESGKKLENQTGMIQTLWRKWGTPRVVLTSSHSLTESPQAAAVSKESELGALLRHCLHLSDGHASQNPRSANALQNSPYSPGLLHLHCLLQDGESGVRVADAVGVLQALLWGPRSALFQLNQAGPSTLINWLLVKRSLLVLKLAERGLFEDQHGADWEDYLCLQYLSLTDPSAVLSATARLGLHNTS